MATSRAATSRSLKFCHRDLPVGDAVTCCSSARMFDDSVASLSAMSRCWIISGSSSWCNVVLLQTVLGSCSCSRSSSRHIIAHMRLTIQYSIITTFVLHHGLHRWRDTSCFECGNHFLCNTNWLTLPPPPTPPPRWLLRRRTMTYARQWRRTYKRWLLLLLLLLLLPLPLPLSLLHYYNY